jgi:hypothetical protein
MNDCQDCERTKEMLLEILKAHTGPEFYDRNKGPSVTNEELIEVLSGVIKDLERIADEM